jgi:predicted RNA-binding Zn-ribbon protein involved in translation (DUF1610 family)
MIESFPPAGYVRVESAVAGIEVYRPAPPDENHERVVDFRCPQCDGVTAYCTDDGGITCAYCRYHEAPQVQVVGTAAEQFEFTVATMRQATHGWGEERKEVECASCGAHTTLSVTMLTHTCPFCGSNRVVQLKAPQDVLRPRFLIPFAVTLEACREKTAAWLGSSWLTPAGLQQLARTAEYTPLYAPFWTFDARARAGWRAEVGHTRTRTVTVNGRRQTRTYTEWRWESGQVDHFFDDFLMPGSSKLSPVLLDQLCDYHLNGLVPYEPAFLAGMQAQAYDVNLEEAWRQARHQMRLATKQKCRSQASSSQIRNFSMELDFADESWRYILLPLYLATYRYRTKSYQLMMNGQTGNMAGQRPVDWPKVALALLAALAPGILLALLAFFLSRPAVAPEPPLVLVLAAAAGLILGVAFAVHTLAQAWRMERS